MATHIVRNALRWTFLAPILSLVLSCDKVNSFQEEYDRAVLAYIDSFSVPDSTSSQSIPVSVAATIGETSAFSFDRINVVRIDTTFRIGVWGREVYKSSIQYQIIHVGVDTVLMLTSPRTGMHYVEMYGDQGILLDSTFVY